MFDIGMTEMLVVGVVAILFIGPRELPGMLRTAGQTIRKVRGMAGDFQRQFDDALRESELDGIKNSVSDIRNLDPTKALKDSLNPLKAELEQTKTDLENIGKSDSGASDDPLVFDDSKAPASQKPVRVDVDAALERQKALDEAATAKKKVVSPAKAKPPKKTVAKTKAAAAKKPAKATTSARAKSTAAAKTKSASAKKPAKAKTPKSAKAAT